MVLPRQVVCVLLMLLIAASLSACGASNSSGASPTAAPTPTHAMGMTGMHGGKPNMSLPTHEVAPAVTAMLMPAGAKGCNGKASGTGSVKMIPVHVGKMSGPHVTLVVSLSGATSMHKYGISSTFLGSPPVKWSAMAESDAADMMGKLHVMTRLMPMLRPGHYTAQILLHDMSCGGMMSNMHPLAYETPKTTITVR